MAAVCRNKGLIAALFFLVMEENRGFLLDDSLYQTQRRNNEGTILNPQFQPQPRKRSRNAGLIPTPSMSRARSTEATGTRHNPETVNSFGDIDYFQNLRFHKGIPTKHPEIFEAVSVENGEEAVYSLRHVPIFFPMSVPIGPGRSVPFAQGPEAVFASTLALHDFNHNISTVVPSVGIETDKCPNLKITTNIFDTELSPRIGTKIASEILKLNPPRKQDINKFEDNPFPSAIIGAGLSSVATSMAVLTGVKSVPQISGTAVSGKLDNKGIYPTFGRVIPSDRGDAQAIVAFLSEVLNVTHLGVLYRQDAFGTDYATAIQQAASMRKPPMTVALSPYTPDDSDKIVEVGAALRFLQNSGYRYFFGAFFSYEYIQIMEQAASFNITGLGYYWMFPSGVSGLITKRIPSNSPIINATIGSTTITPASSSILLAVGADTTRVTNFNDHWANATSFKSTGDYLYSLFQNETQKLFPKERLLDYLDWTGLAVMMYEAGMAVALAACRSYKKHGQHFTGAQMFSEFLNVTFDGISGLVSMETKTGTRIPQTLTYSILGFAPYTTESGEVMFKTVPFYAYQVVDKDSPLDRKWKKLDGANIFFSGNTTTPPEPLPPLEIQIIRIETWAQVLGVLLVFVVIFLSIFFAVWTAIHRDTKVIRAAQPIFLYMLCTGTFILGLSILPLTLEHQLNDNLLDTACMTTPWLVSGGFIIAFSAIFSKLKRVNALFNAGSHQKILVETRDVIRLFIILFVLNVGVLTAWTFVDPLKHSIINSDATDRFGRPLEAYGRCISYDPNAVYLTFMVLWAGIILAVIIFANVEAYKARLIATDYSESQHLALSMILILQAILIGVPLLFVPNALPTFWYLVKISILFIVCISILLPVFLPKMKYLRQWREEQSKREMRKSQRLQNWAEMKARIEEEEFNQSSHLSSTSKLGGTNRTSE